MTATKLYNVTQRKGNVGIGQHEARTKREAVSNAIGVHEIMAGIKLTLCQVKATELIFDIRANVIM